MNLEEACARYRQDSKGDIEEIKKTLSEILKVSKINVKSKFLKGYSEGVSLILGRREGSDHVDVMKLEDGNVDYIFSPQILVKGKEIEDLL